MDEMIGLLAQHGLALVFVNVLLTQSGVPLPAVPTLIVAGAFVAQGQIALLPLVAVSVGASLLGDIPWYFAGRRYGYRILRTLCRVSLEPDSCVKQTENIFTRFGPPALLVAKYIPGFSTVAPPLAGTMHVGLCRFIAYSAVAAALWAALPVAAGFFFRKEVERLLDYIETMGAGALAIVATILVVYVSAKAIERYMLLRFLRMIRISPAELRGLIERGQAPVIIDARSSLAREAEPRRIRGAIDAELSSLETVLDAVPPDREVVVYCS